MGNPTDGESIAVLAPIKLLAAEERIRITQHAHQEMIEEEITLDDVLHTIRTAELIENYPEHRRGACCLLSGITKGGRWLHVVCTTAQPVLVVVTVYEPRLPKWKTPSERSGAR
jgi:hypothetical protein